MAYHYRQQSRTFRLMDTVRVTAKRAALRLLQIGHGGYKSDLPAGELGSVIDVDTDGDVVVYFKDSGRHFLFNPTALEYIHEDEVHQDTNSSDGQLEKGKLQCNRTSTLEHNQIFTTNSKIVHHIREQHSAT